MVYYNVVTCVNNPVNYLFIHKQYLTFQIETSEALRAGTGF